MEVQYIAEVSEKTKVLLLYKYRQEAEKAGKSATGTRAAFRFCRLLDTAISWPEAMHDAQELFPVLCDCRRVCSSILLSACYTLALNPLDRPAALFQSKLTLRCSHVPLTPTHLAPIRTMHRRVRLVSTRRTSIYTPEA